MEMCIKVILLAFTCIPLQAQPTLPDHYYASQMSDMYVFAEMVAERMSSEIAKMQEKIVVQLRSEMIHGFNALQKVTNTMKSEIGEIRTQAQNITEQINQFKEAVMMDFGNKIDHLAKQGVDTSGSLDEQIKQLIKQENNTTIAATAKMTSLENKIEEVSKQVARANVAANTAMTTIGSQIDLIEMKISVAANTAMTAIGSKIDLMEIKMHNTSVAANTATTAIGSKVDLMEMKMHNNSVAVAAALAAIGIQIDLMEMKMHNTSVASTAVFTTLASNTTMADVGSQIDLIQKQVYNASAVSRDAMTAMGNRLQENLKALAKQLNSSSVAADTAMAAFGSQMDLIQKQLFNTGVMCELSVDAMRLQSSCAAIHTRHQDATSGVYTVYPGGRAPGRSVWCDMVTDGGGWTRVQHRQDGSVAFNETWDVYQRGFGSPAGEFWLGNDDLHRLTAAQPSELRVDIWDFVRAHRYAKYSSFRVGNQTTNYTLQVSGFSGDAGDSMAYSNNRPFSTTDRDHDSYSGTNCAARRGGGGWWYGQCTHANLNGRYHLGGVNTHQGVYWSKWRSNTYSYKAVSMVTRPRQ